ncbi:MAG: hypothetical protein AAF985_22055, partial [Bacteroidota bacterium]
FLDLVELRQSDNGFDFFHSTEFLGATTGIIFSSSSLILRFPQTVVTTVFCRDSFGNLLLLKWLGRIAIFIFKVALGLMII